MSRCCPAAPAFCICMADTYLAPCFPLLSKGGRARRPTGAAVMEEWPGMVQAIVTLIRGSNERTQGTPDRRHENRAEGRRQTAARGDSPGARRDQAARGR